jgi:hypothetical protein
LVGLNLSFLNNVQPNPAATTTLATTAMAMIADLLSLPSDPPFAFDAALVAEELAEWEVETVVRTMVG